MSPEPANVAQKPAQESRAGGLRLQARPSAVSMVVRLAAVRQLASVMGHGRGPIQPIDHTRTETPSLEGLLGHKEGAEHRPGRHSRHQRGATDPIVAIVNANTDRNYALHES